APLPVVPTTIAFPGLVATAPFVTAPVVVAVAVAVAGAIVGLLDLHAVDRLRRHDLHRSGRIIASEGGRARAKRASEPGGDDELGEVHGRTLLAGFDGEGGGLFTARQLHVQIRHATRFAMRASSRVPPARWLAVVIPVVIVAFVAAHVLTVRVAQNLRLYAQ